VRPARQEPAAVIEAAAIAPGPSIPSNADVARAATQGNELRLREVNLIGVTGTASDRRALVRLPSGRFVRVGVGRPAERRPRGRDRCLDPAICPQRAHGHARHSRLTRLGKGPPAPSSGFETRVEAVSKPPARRGP
jgi:hypothetical protein